MATEYLRKIADRLECTCPLDNDCYCVYEWIDSLGYRENIKIHDTNNHIIIVNRFTIYPHKVVDCNHSEVTEKRMIVLGNLIITTASGFCIVGQRIIEKDRQKLLNGIRNWPKKARRYIETLGYCDGTNSDYLEHYADFGYINCIDIKRSLELKYRTNDERFLIRVMRIAFLAERRKNMRKFATVSRRFADISVRLRPGKTPDFSRILPLRGRHFSGIPVHFPTLLPAPEA